MVSYIVQEVYKVYRLGVPGQALCRIFLGGVVVEDKPSKLSCPCFVLYIIMIDVSAE